MCLKSLEWYQMKGAASTLGTHWVASRVMTVLIFLAGKQWWGNGSYGGKRRQRGRIWRSIKQTDWLSLAYLRGQSLGCWLSKVKQYEQSTGITLKVGVGEWKALRRDSHPDEKKRQGSHGSPPSVKRGCFQDLKCKRQLSAEWNTHRSARTDASEQ